MVIFVLGLICGLVVGGAAVSLVLAPLVAGRFAKALDDELRNRIVM